MTVLVQKITVALFFVFLLLIGLSVYDDYGISWDEHYHRYFGVVSAFYVNEIFSIVPTREVLNFGGEVREIPADLGTYFYRNYGVAFEMILVGFEYLFNLADSREVYLFRHFATFIVFFVGVIFFYLTIYRVFRNRMVAILGCLLLVVSPRIFSHSFYDLKDIVPLSLSVTSIYTLVRLLEKPTLIRAVLHALSVALFIDTRVAGIFLPAVTLLFLGLEYVRSYRQGKSLVNLSGVCLTFVGCLLIFIYIFWPYLWEAPISRFLAAVINMGNFAEEYEYNVEMVYMGSFIFSKEVPWHYLPVWIGITTPVVYSGLFLIGVSTILCRLWRKQTLLLENGEERFGLLVLVLFFGPVVAVIAVGSMLLDGWRHMYFCYPAFLLVGITGFEYFRKNVPLNIQKKKWRTTRRVALLVLLLGVAGTAKNMVTNHPYQATYFNSLAGRDIAKNWELDYWGGSFRQALEYVLDIDDSPEINISVSSEPGVTNLNILVKEDRDRVKIVNEQKAKYYLSHYRFRKDYERFHGGQPPFDKEIFSIEISSILDKYKIMGVYLIE